MKVEFKKELNFKCFIRVGVSSLLRVTLAMILGMDMFLIPHIIFRKALSLFCFCNMGHAQLVLKTRSV